MNPTDHCAAFELCLCKNNVPVASTHQCPACKKRVHAICGEICEDAGILYHTTCFKCFALYDTTFKDPDDFDDFRSRTTTLQQDFTAAAATQRLATSTASTSTFMIEDTAECPPQGRRESPFLEADAGAKNDKDVTILPGLQEHQFDLYKAAVSDSVTEKTQKAKKRQEFIRKLTLSQCVVEVDAGTSTRVLVSIAGIPLSKLLLNDLMSFCSTHKIKGYRQKKKDEVSRLIAARVASDNIYASIGYLGMKCSAVVPSTSTAVKKKAYKSKLDRPKAVTKAGTYFRAISLWFSSQNRHMILRTGKKMNRTELDVGGYRHKMIWDSLAEQFNKNTGVPECGDAEDNTYLDVIQSPHHLYNNEDPEDFDQLEGQDLAQFIRWITNQYYVVHKSVSGDHARFEDRIGEKGYLLYFHNMIADTGAENLESLMKAELSPDVFAESLIHGSRGSSVAASTSNEAIGQEETPFSTKKRKSRGPPSSTREKTDEAILRFLSTQETDDAQERTVASRTVASSSKDEYIQERKRIVVRADEVARTREISAAVEFNLQKWKKCLNELKDMEKNDGFSVHHPIYIATMATAELYETSFNASLATAKRAQLVATAAEFASPSTAMRPSAGSTISSNDRSYNYDDDKEGGDEDEDEDEVPY